MLRRGGGAGGVGTGVGWEGKRLGLATRIKRSHCYSSLLTLLMSMLCPCSCLGKAVIHVPVFTHEWLSILVANAKLMLFFTSGHLGGHFLSFYNSMTIQIQKIQSCLSQSNKEMTSSMATVANTVFVFITGC